MRGAQKLACALGVVGLLFLSGCPETRSATPTECAQLGERCQLPDGPIGICSETTEPCDSPPCIACMSQH